MRKLASKIYIVKGAKAPFEVLVVRPPIYYPLDDVYHSRKRALTDARHFRNLDGGKYIIRRAQHPLVTRRLKKRRKKRKR